MLRCLAPLGIFACLVSALRAESFPYTAYVRSDDVNVRSGPGDNYYPVSKLNRGDAVEVYRHDPGGWYAIRPPAGSFSWVSGEFLKPTGGNTALVIGERIVARVGSSFSDVRDVIQIRLERGEEVEVIEAKRFNTGPAAQTWYKITPPAGEFRWVSGKFVERELKQAAPRDRGPKNNMILARMAEEEKELDDELEAEGRYSPEDESVYVPAPRRKHHPHQREREPLDEAGDPMTYEPRAHHSTRTRLPAHTDIPELLDELDLQLSTMVTSEPTAWDFSEIGDKAEAALGKSETAVERGQARLLLAKIQRFEDIRSRWVAVVEVTSETDRRNQQLAARMRTVMPHAAGSEPRYDGSGKLAQVVAGRDGAPQFALLDSNGAVRYYVSPSPGVNLRNYVGMEVGVNGTLGYLPSEHAQHVTAKRIIPLGGASTTLR